MTKKFIHYFYYLCKSKGPNGGSSLYNQGQAGSAINTATYGTTPQGGAGANGGHILQQITYL